MTLPRLENGSARTCPTIPGRHPHIKLTDVSVLQTRTARLCPTILEGRPYTKFLDVPTGTECFIFPSLLQDVKVVYCVTHSILPKPILILS